MPGRDGTGPVGAGPMTGRGLGPCSGATVPYGAGLGQRFGRGAGCGRGLRYGFGRGFFSVPVSEETQKEQLLEQKELLQRRLDAIDKQLENR